MTTIDLTSADVDLLLNALQTWKTHTERHLIGRSEQGWDNHEQQTRIQAIDELEERLYALSTAEQSTPLARKR